MSPAGTLLERPTTAGGHLRRPLARATTEVLASALGAGVLSGCTPRYERTVRVTPGGYGTARPEVVMSFEGEDCAVTDAGGNATMVQLSIPFPPPGTPSWRPVSARPRARSGRPRH